MRLPGNARTARIVVPVLTLLSATLAPAAAQTPSIQPGEWRVTTRTVMNGAAQPPTMRPRCFSAEQAGDVAKTFGPQFGIANSTCDEPAIETGARMLAWRLACRGQMNMDVQASFSFDSETRYTATVTSKTSMAGAPLADVRTEIEGERLGECAQ